MIKPPELESDSGRDIWATITAAETGDTETLRGLLRRDPGLSRAEYFYTQPIHFAVRSGHLEAVQLLLDAGADPEWNSFHHGSLIEMARDRGHENIAEILEQARERRGRVVPGPDHPIHQAARTDDVQRVRELLDAAPSLLDRGDKLGGTPLHRAVTGSARRVVALLLDRGANIHAIHSTSGGSGRGWGPWDVQAIDLAIFGNNPTAPAKGDFQTARLFVERGATCDVTIAAALGDLDRVRSLLDQNPERIREIRPNGRRPLTAALAFRHSAVARFLLERGADPGWPEVGSPNGASLRIAAGDGDREMVELLLAHGADPHSDIDSGGSALFAAKTPEIRAMLAARAGEREPDPFDLVWQNQDDEVMRRVKADPKSADLGCGGFFTAVCTLGKRDLMMRLLEAGIRVPAVLTACRTYVMENLEMFKILLAHGMNPDLPNWQGQTFLHNLCSGGRRREADGALVRAAILLDAGASISPREDEYCSTPLGWAARTNMPDMVEFLLVRGAPVNLPDDPPWATPLAWAQRRGHTAVAEILRMRGAQ
ncbi:MAG TPA: ankyrin repeat domain-containing protein [Bryobacteraceae bacterium]